MDGVCAGLLRIVTDRVRLVVEWAEGESGETIHRRVAAQSRDPTVTLQCASSQLIFQSLPVPIKFSSCGVQYIEVEVQLRGRIRLASVLWVPNRHRERSNVL
jgi:hypothetical protein